MTPTHIFRPFEPSPAEYEAVVRVYNLAKPDEPASAATWEHWDQHRDPSKFFTRYVVQLDGAIGGYGFSVRTDVKANIYRFAIHLIPGWATVDLIGQFYSYIMGLCLESNPNGLVCQTLEDESIKIAWLEGQGFRQSMRYPHSTLDVAAFDPIAFSGLGATIAGQGLEIISLAELASLDPAWQRKVYDLEMLLSQDVPQPTAFSPPPFENYAQSEFEDPNYSPELWLIVRDGDAYVGMTTLFRMSGNYEVLETGLTGIRRDYRRRGLVTALKSKNIEIAQSLGGRIIHTWNEENNPMFQLNLQLGFEAQPADVDWKKALAGGR